MQEKDRIWACQADHKEKADLFVSNSNVQEFGELFPDAW